ncbi:MAG: YcaO-like family protein [Paracoccus sp. (in: a-proteobacteria)]|uniref:YcaO-like family protein n=1 Tax=Paracoccus sp. TaxID=267 RepID=UPI0039E247BD
MTKRIFAGDELAASWRCFDWRENFLAPGLSILQALTGQGQTASGAGLSRAEAYDRCIGETAELLALARMQAQGDNFEATRDGIAAHADPAEARASAICEAHERRAVAAWWLGHAPARPIAPHWLLHSGTAELLARARRGAALKRPTDFWLIEMGHGPHVVIARSMSLERQDPVLGYGVHRDPARAAEKALRELLLMELNLMELLAARAHGSDGAYQSVQDRIRDFARRGPQLFPDQPPVVPGPPVEGRDLDWFDRPPHLCDLLPGGEIEVWLCRPDTPPPRFSRETGLPYL